MRQDIGDVVRRLVLGQLKTTVAMDLPEVLMHGTKQEAVAASVSGVEPVSTHVLVAGCCSACRRPSSQAPRTSAS